MKKTAKRKAQPKPDYLVRLSKNPDFRRFRREIRKLFSVEAKHPLAKMAQTGRVLALLELCGVPQKQLQQMTVNMAMPLAAEVLMHFLPDLPRKARSSAGARTESNSACRATPPQPLKRRSRKSPKA